mmetsp:Transcript_83774/g.242282  ORF Transcript_83774/g.242282 Transcript_83774/m.242282 type:complete len:211 (+) Transcript_83774:587-1219(+)
MVEAKQLDDMRVLQAAQATHLHPRILDHLQRRQGALIYELDRFLVFCLEVYGAVHKAELTLAQGCLQPTRSDLRADGEARRQAEVQLRDVFQEVVHRLPEQAILRLLALLFSSLQLVLQHLVVLPGLLLLHGPPRKRLSDAEVDVPNQVLVVLAVQNNSIGARTHKTHLHTDRLFLIVGCGVEPIQQHDDRLDACRSNRLQDTTAELQAC